jgi:NAD+ diphosphatase
MLPLTGFVYCPRCGRPDLENQGQKAARCRACGFVFYHNAAAAAAAIIETAAGVLLVRRNREPQRGKLDLPGGFVEYGESAEDAVLREVREELGLEIQIRGYIGSYPNRYPYRDVTYFTTDMVYTASPAGAQSDLGAIQDGGTDLEEVGEVIVMDPLAIDLETIAFLSMRRALEDYLKLLAR